MTEFLPATVCIVGAGPAGSTAARRLSQMGHSVLVLEKQVFPRPHIGESLTPGVVPLFRALEIDDRMEHERFLRPHRALVHWPPLCGYKEFGTVPGFQVDRSRFDSILLSAASEAGASVMVGALLDVVTESPEGGWEIAFRCRGSHFAARPRIILDATGRRSILGGKKTRYGAPTLALFAYARNRNSANAETRVEAGTNEWFWGAPLPDGRFIGTVFVDPGRIQKLLKRTDLRAIYYDLLRRSQLLSRSGDFDSFTPVIVCDATCYYHDEPISGNLIRVGESSFSVDPLSSQGVQAAMGSALHAAAVANTILRSPDDRHLAEDFYRKRQQESVAFHRAAAGELYAQAAKAYPEEFWHLRSGKAGVNDAKTERNHLPPLLGTTKIRLSPQAKLVTEPLLKDDRIVLGRPVTHPNISRPLAFLDGISVASLLEPLGSPLEATKVLGLWRQWSSESRTKELLQWLWEMGVIVSEAKASQDNGSRSR